MFRFVLAAFTTLTLHSLSVSPAPASILTAAEDFSKFGDLNQHNTDCDDVACGPTAATNSFVFLQNSYPNTYDTKLVPHIPGNDFGQDEAAVANGLANLMNTCNECNPGGGTYIEDFIAGKQEYLDTAAPNKTVYAAQMNIAWRMMDPAGNNVGAKPPYVQDSTIPTAQFITNEIAAGEDVEVLLSDDINHYVTLFGITYDTVLKKGDIEYIDPETGSVGVSSITGMDANGYLDVAYGTNSEKIASVVAESPIPEPAAWVLSGFGLIVLLAAKQRRRGRPRMTIRGSTALLWGGADHGGGADPAERCGQPEPAARVVHP